METILEFLKNNQIASGGLLIGVMAFLYQHGMRMLNFVNIYIKKSTLVTYHFSSNEGFDLYNTLDDWIKGIIITNKKNITDIAIKLNQEVIQHGRWIVSLPQVGFAYISIITKSRKDTDSIVDGTKIHETTITIFKRNKNKLKAIIDKFKEVNNSDVVYEIEHSNVFEVGDFPKKHINLNSVILDNTLSQDLFNDLKTFLNSKEKYYNLGNTYKRIYLLSGPPGNGKTSIIKLISNYLNYSIINCSLEKISSRIVRDAMSYTNDKALFIFEDIDRENLNDSKINISNLLNLFDGITTPECIIILTCNDISKFDPAFIRPGRVDRIFEVKNANKDQVRRMFLKYYPAEDTKIDNAIKDYPCHLLSMSKIQECLQVGDNIDSAIELFKKNIEQK